MLDTIVSELSSSFKWAWLVAHRPPGSTSFDPATAAAFGRVVRQARLEAGISQESLAYMAGVERSYFGRIERGQNQPTLHVILKVAAALGYEAGALVTLVEKAMVKGHVATE
ncbi:helix-turn-helix domain-containing protein [Sphaerotilus montanus]|uniref:Ribosome-binding protein aMBF1 (Putative translation factor) n=1 Tax=Sphaerotilus montanus TaxID=522889 RepID=A0A7Y9R032_9BURK|nr:helix-turn-helix transcriptional regulator [Sphaerotilus montanus]NYG33008.1 ribosome-binding protein aMBF1 (putative translation factor) [Sphaerotilus montanus]